MGSVVLCYLSWMVAAFSHLLSHHWPSWQVFQLMMPLSVRWAPTVAITPSKYIPHAHMDEHRPQFQTLHSDDLYYTLFYPDPYSQSSRVSQVHCKRGIIHDSVLSNAAAMHLPAIT